MIDFDTCTKIALDLGKLIVAKGFQKLPKVQKIAQSGHTVREMLSRVFYFITAAVCYKTDTLKLSRYSE